MDESPEYVKMCEKAEKIQKKRFYIETLSKLYRDGDFLVKEGRVIVARQPDGFICLEEELNTIWLPCQGQLQILSGLSWADFDSKCREYWFQDVRHEITKEQAGIRAVMDYQFNKTWQGGKWLDKTTQ